MSNRTADLDLTGATEAFCARLSAEGRATATIAAYRRDLALVARVAGELAPGIVCRAVTAGFLDQVFSAGAVTESERGPRSAASLHRMKAAVRAFFAWAVEVGVVDDNPARSIRMQRLPRKLPVFLTTAEKKRLLKELKGRTDFSALRDRAMIEVLLGTGIRLGELAALDMDDIDLDAKHLRVRAKGNVPQVKFIKTDLRTLLRRYLAERRRHGRPEMEALFLSNRDGRLCQRQIANRLAHWLRKAGIEKELTPHGLRHTFATHLYGATNDLLVVQRALGHRDVSTTQIYTHLVDGQLEEALERL
ncbi:tyrosine-type recombinase/integrase [Syntrophobacter fumaroxidans]|uniref:Phage integrase family protein n=1 Tax=Syntrophobacter fumaroxidans (strain DSM 10017 / MPOB) TaxID=335543 RepID=A0LPW3_SYNFM|nr:tyrosine-type recombinase/integrase [Syntrophobacter fumaroxidans]ABK19465.1 phage integrase family protein [Syntrophobacter fumaroxidans MPOB]